MEESGEEHGEVHINIVRLERELSMEIHANTDVLDDGSNQVAGGMNVGGDDLVAVANEGNKVEFGLVVRADVEEGGE